MSVSFSYALSPPDSIPASSAVHAGTPVPASGSASVPLPSADSVDPALSATEAFYARAAPALRDAQARLMEVLTAWKDAVGDAEKHKEATGKVKFGQGKAARMMAADRAAEAAEDAAKDGDEDSDESSEGDEW
jgi:hypothetical protein